MMITADLAKGQKLATDNGALIQGDKNNPAVLPNSPAAKAGLKAGDIITEINGEKLTQDKSLGSVLQEYNVGDVITLKVFRAGVEMTFKITLEERPKNL